MSQMNILEVFEYNQHFVAMMNIINAVRGCHYIKVNGKRVHVNEE